MGNPQLTQTASEVIEFNTPELGRLVEDMFDTMRDANGAGLAAPQIGVLLRVVVFGFEHNPRYPDAPGIPETVLINPAIKPLTDEKTEGWEGCLSVPGMRGVVPRYRHIEYSACNISGEQFTVQASDFHARVIQHECDHLDGILYPQRITDMNQFGFIEELVQADRI